LAVSDTEWLLEIKTFAGEPALSQPRDVVVREVLATLAACRLPAACTRILSFDWEVLRIFAALAPQYKRICLTEPSKPSDIWWGRQYHGLTEAAAAAKTGAAGLAPSRDSLTTTLGKEAHALGLDVYAWTVNDPNDLHQLQGLADAIITDIPMQLSVVSRQSSERILKTDH
jgi:glycerophosphoryl diester phosphodiesterase